MQLIANWSLTSWSAHVAAPARDSRVISQELNQPWDELGELAVEPS